MTKKKRRDTAQSDLANVVASELRKAYSSGFNQAEYDTWAKSPPKEYPWVRLLTGEALARRLAEIGEEDRLASRHSPPSFDERVKALGGGDLSSCFKRLVAAGSVSEEGLESALHFLEDFVRTPHARQMYAQRIAMQTKRLTTLREHISSALGALEIADSYSQDAFSIPRGLAKVILVGLWQAYTATNNHLRTLPKLRRGSVPTGIDSDQATHRLVRILCKHVTDWSDDRSADKQALRDQVEQILRVLKLRRKQRLRTRQSRKRAATS
jgi:hypothetical protein